VTTIWEDIADIYGELIILRQWIISSKFVILIIHHHHKHSDLISNYLLLKKDSAPWSYLVTEILISNIVIAL
jgi:hypothetical protein